MKKTPKIYVVIVTYNGLKWYDKCLGFLEQSSIPIKTIVVDNASTDGTQQYIKNKFPNVKLIESNENLGFAKANNIGIRYAYDKGADYVFLLNQDAWIFPKTLELLLDSFYNNNDAGIISPMHLNGKMNSLDFNFSTNMPGEFVSDSYFKKLKNDYEVPYVNAAAWLISRNCIETVGGFDTNLYVHYGEDIDYCKRIKYFGYKLYVNTLSTICHDREFRKKFNEKYKISVFKRDERIHRLKGEYGNINIDIDIRNILKKNKIKIIKSLFFCRFKNISIIKKDIDLFKQIEHSRFKNMSGGLVWL